ncbi:MAG: SH3 domain-containing protein [Rhodopila sp.]
MRRIAVSLTIVVALLAAGCDKEACPPPLAAGAPDALADVRKVAETSVRLAAANADAVRFRGVQVWPQAAKNQFAVCGQTNVFGPSSSTFVLFVAVVTRDEVGQDPARKFKAESRVGSTITEATRVYVDALTRCYEGGGPQQVLRHDIVPPLPPLPDDPKAVLAGPAPVAPPAPASPPQPPAPSAVAGASSASGTVVMRQNGNIRSTPQGQTLGVVPAGKELHVFGEAPGGWLRVGDAAPNGWVHSSLVQRR